MLVVKDACKVAQVIKRNAALRTIPPRDFDLGQLPGLALLLAFCCCIVLKVTLLA